MQPLPQASELIELTDRAAQVMKSVLRNARGRGIRIVVLSEKGGRSYRLTVEDRARASDLVIERKGVPLYVSPAQSKDMPEMRIDYVRRDGREGFTIQPLGGCGCGPDCACGG